MHGTNDNTIIGCGTNGVYYSDFCATSAATPLIAGIAALVLSVNNNLTAAEVRSIIKMTAQKLNGYTYTTTSAHPEGLWNNEVGYGLVDAQAAVQSAICASSMSNFQALSSNKFIRSCNGHFDIPSLIEVRNNAKLTVFLVICIRSVQRVKINKKIRIEKLYNIVSLSWSLFFLACLIDN
jgi:hypothetical protein